MKRFTRRLFLKQRHKDTFIHELLTGAFDSSLQIIFLLFISFQTQPNLIIPWLCFSFFMPLLLKLVSFAFQLFHVKIQEVLYMDDNRKSVRTLLSADSCDLSAVKTTPWWEEANLLVSKARCGMEKYPSAMVNLS